MRATAAGFIRIGHADGIAAGVHEPRSPFFSDQTRLLSRKQRVPEYFCAAAVKAHTLSTTAVGEGPPTRDASGAELMPFAGRTRPVDRFLGRAAVHELCHAIRLLRPTQPGRHWAPGDHLRLAEPAAEHGEHLAFLDVRDRSGTVQRVSSDSAQPTFDRSTSCRSAGRCGGDREGLENPGLPTGEIEIADCQVVVLSEAEPPTFTVTGDQPVDESVRLRYRYLDLRRERMQRESSPQGTRYRGAPRVDAGPGLHGHRDAALVDAHSRGAREFVVLAPPQPR